MSELARTGTESGERARSTEAIPGIDHQPVKTARSPSAPRDASRLFEPGRNCATVAHAHRAAVLVDAEAYYAALMEAAYQARHSIIIIGWDFDTRTRLTYEDDHRGWPPLLGDFLNWLAQRRRELHVHILDWDYPLVFGTDRELRPIYGLGWTPHRRVHLHYDNTHPVGGSHHQKIVVIDDALAFAGGLDLTCRRWDTCAHEAGDHRRTAGDKPYPPFHDVMAAVDGEAAAALANVARERWLRATGRAIAPVRRAHDPWPATLEPLLHEVDVAVARTVPQANGAAEVREVEALYVDMIAAARDYIYIENQYFTSDAVGSALAKRLAAPDPPQIVLVTRLLSHGWLEEYTMHVLRTRLIDMLREADRHGRFEVYYPHVDGLDDGTCIDCHSKVIIIDDAWLRIGSANLSNRSMGFDTECDLAFAAHDEASAKAIRHVRDTLLAEHLGVPLEETSRAMADAPSLHDGIRALQRGSRTLRVLEELPEWSAAVVDLAGVADPEKPVSLDELIGEFAPDVEEHRRRPAWGRLAAVAAVCIVLAVLWRYTAAADLVDPSRIAAWAEAMAALPWAPVAVVLAYTVAAFVMFPRPVITLFAVIAFGPPLGFAYALGGIALAAMVTYWTGRALPRDTVRTIAGDRLNRITEVLRRRGLLAIFAIRVVPAAPFVIVGIVAGAIRLPALQYLLGTVLAMLPGTLATSVFGDQLRVALQDPSRINYWLVAGVVALFLVIAAVVRVWFVRQRGSAARAGHAGPRHAHDLRSAA